MVDRPGTLTRKRLTQAIHDKAGLPRSRAERLVDGIIGRISEALERGEQVKISGFGTFRLNEKVARVGRNPKTGVVHDVTARRVISFKPSAGLRAKVAPIPEGGDLPV